MRKQVVIVGVGALGSHVAMLLRSISDIELWLIDYDRVEQKNTQSAFFGKSNVGKLKVEALRGQMNLLWGAQPKIETRPVKLIRDNVAELLGDADLVIDCLDNGESRRVVQEWVRLQGFVTDAPGGRGRPAKSLLHGALAADGAFGRVIWDEHFIPDEAGQGAATCAGGEHLPFIGIVASWLAYAAQQFLADGRKVGFQVSPAAMVRI